MKTLKLILLLIFINYYSPVFSQAPKIKWSPVFDKDGDNFDNVIYDDGKNLYVATTRKVKKGDGIIPGIAKYGEDMKLAQVENYTVEQKDIFYHGIYYTGGNFLLILSFKDKNTDSWNINALQIDKNSLKVKGSTKLLMTVNSPKSKDPSCSIVISPDTSKIGLISFADVKKSEKEKMSYKIYDSGLTEVNSGEAVSEKESDLYRSLSIRITNSGSLVVFKKIYNTSSGDEYEKNSAKKKIPSYKFVINTYEKNKEVRNTNVDLKENIAGNLLSSSDMKTDDICFLATKQSAENDKRVIGYQFMRFDAKKGELKTNNEYLFTESFIVKMNRSFMVDDYKKEGMPSSVSLTSFRILDDGRIFATMENNFSKDDGLMYSLSVVALMLDNDGKSVWQHVVVKNQMYRGMLNYLSHKVIYTKKGIMILYDDKMAPVNQSFEDVAKKSMYFNAAKEMSLVSAAITNEGELKRTVYSNTEAMGTNIWVTRSVQLRNDSFILYGSMLSGAIMAGRDLSGDVKLGRVNLD